MALSAAHANGSGTRPAVFLDKDGTLLVDVPYNVNADCMHLYPEVPSVLARLREQGYLLIVISNQPGVALGYFDAATMESMVSALHEKLEACGVTLDGVYCCPHHPAGEVRQYAVECDCRKPRAGLLLRAAEDLDVDMQNSWMIGDILNDMEAGNRAGCRTVLVDRGNETEWIDGPYRKPDAVVSDLRGALAHINEQPMQWQRRHPS